MLSSPPAPNDVMGSQTPRLAHWPEYASSAGQEAVELAALAGLGLDPWQQFVLGHALGERPDGMWAAPTVGLVVSRQNGKGALLEARELAGLFLLGESLIIHSAHEFQTAMEAFQRILYLIESTPDLERRVLRVSKSHGDEGITLKNGARLRFKARTKAGGRGFSCDCLILDEAMILPDASQAAMLPTLSARPNPQVWYVGSAVNQRVHYDGFVFTRVREAGLAGDDETAFFEWSLDPALVPDALANLNDTSFLIPGNPGLGRRLTVQKIWALERPPKMTPEEYAVERLGAGDWPATGDADGLFDPADVTACEDSAASITGPWWLAFDVKPDGKAASVVRVGWTSDASPLVEVLETRSGTGWVAPKVGELRSDPDCAGLVADDKGPASAVIKQLEKDGVDLRVVTATELGAGCALYRTGFAERTIRHRGDLELLSAMDGAAERNIGDGAKAWSRKSSDVNIAPLVAASLALGEAHQAPPKAVEPWFRVV